MKARKWTDADAKRLGKMYKAGVPDDVIGEALGRSRDAIKSQRYKTGFVGLHDHHRISEAAAKLMIQTRYSGPKHGAWKGGCRLSSGYVDVRHDASHPRCRSIKGRKMGYIREHILVVEKALGRPLEPIEVIHHRDGNRTNNDISNLLVMRRSDHTRAHRRKSTRVELICKVCGQAFMARKFQADIRITCSRSCAAKRSLWGVGK